MLPTFSMQRPRTATAVAIKEFSRVRLTEALLAEGYLLPEGAEGAVVLKHGRGEAFEVEFTEPFHAVVGVPSELLRLLEA